MLCVFSEGVELCFVYFSDCTVVFCVFSEGVQLLVLIDKGLDACRYLQDYGQWDQAAWLAKVQEMIKLREQVLRTVTIAAELGGGGGGQLTFCCA